MPIDGENILFGRTYTLEEGEQVRFRLARSSDHRAVAELAASAGTDVDELGIARLLHADPRRQAVLCATALVDARETMLGFGATPLVSEREPGARSLVIVDPEIGAELRGLMTLALASRRATAAPRQAGGLHF